MKKQTKLSADIQSSRCLYKKRKNRNLLDLLHAYQNGKLGKYSFILEMQKKHNVLFDLQKILKSRHISSILIEQDSLTIELKEQNLKFVVDNACRSPLFELLNFGSYEYEEMQMIKNLIGEQEVIFDIGSHLGWYSVILGKNYKTSKFYAFEPIQNTYKLLEKNISINMLDNVEFFNFGFSDKARTAQFYYSEVGSAVASEKDIFDMKNLDTIQCNLEKLDDFVETKTIQKIDFMKCDVEGAEFLVIKGGANSIRKFLPILFLELVEDWCNKFNYTILDVTAFLFSLGYKMFEIKGDRLSQLHEIGPDKIDNFNFLFLHQKKHEHFIEKYLQVEQV